MYDKINELKELMRQLYNSYLESDKKESIVELGKLFNIPIIDVVANNYKVTSIDIDNLSIEIKDEIYGVIYKSSYTSKCDLLKFNGNILRFIVIEEIDENKTIKKVYHIGEDKPFITKMTFEENGYVIEFEKEESTNEDTFLDNGKSLSIRYLINNDGVYEPLLTRIEKRNNGDSFERIFTYDGIDYSNNGDLLDKSIYILNKDMIYVVDDAAFKNPIGYIKGICFESMNVDINRYLPNGINISDYKGLTLESTLSCIIFKGIIEDNLYVLEIYKNSENISIQYHVQNNAIEMQKDMVVHNEIIELEAIDNGKISVSELSEICNVLGSKDEFILKVLNELLRFSKKIYIKNGMIEEEYDPLSPRMLFDKDFELIARTISNYKKDYFNFINNQFEMITEHNGKVK